MIKILAALALALTTSAAAAAQDKKYFNTRLDCAPLPQIMQEVVAAYDEQPLFIGQSITQDLQGRLYQGGAMMFVNQTTGTWSVITMYADGIACVSAFGNDFEPYVD